MIMGEKVTLVNIPASPVMAHCLQVHVDLFDYLPSIHHTLIPSRSFSPLAGLASYSNRSPTLGTTQRDGPLKQVDKYR